MEQKFCQSCGMPLTEEILGTNADGIKNEDYCIYCYKDGADAELIMLKRRENEKNYCYSSCHYMQHKDDGSGHQSV